MSISPPSDIVLDVARAADPVRLSEAAARLTRTKPGDAAAFANLLGDMPATETVAAAAPPPAALPLSGPAPQKRAATSAEAFQRFEAMTLATMIEAAMPSEASSVFGDGTAGSVWKSMMAEQLGNQMAKVGGIGLASQLQRSAEAGLLGGGPMTLGEAGEQARSLLVTNIERGALEDIRPGAATDDSDDYASLQDTV